MDSQQEVEAIQQQGVLAYGRSAEGYALAATTNRCARLLNCEAPVVAPLFAEDRLEDGGILNVTSSILGAGAELVFRFGRSFPTMDDDPSDPDTILDAIVGCQIGLQILGRRFRPDIRMDRWTALADFGLAAYHVRGVALTDWRDTDLRVLPISLIVDGHRMADGHAGDALGDPLAAVSWLARALSDIGSCIEAGSFVGTGSCTGLVQLVPGHVVTGSFGSDPARVVSVFTR